MKIKTMANLVIICSSICTVVSFANESKAQDIPRTPWGHPDFQGFYTYRTITPLQRPRELADKSVLSAEEAAEWAAQENLRQNRDLIDDRVGGAGYAPGVISYNEFWYERGDDVIDSRRTSLIYDPPNGRIPSTTAAAQERRREQFEISRASIGVEARPLAERCLMSFGGTIPMIPKSYNNNVQIVQTQDHIMILYEMIHLARIVPFTSKFSGQAKWEGDAIAQWEGDTLIIKTENFYYDSNYGGSTKAMKLVERIKRIGENTLDYDFTIEDPNTWTTPWSAKFPLQEINEPIFEYACHEGNIGLTSVMSGWRHLESMGLNGDGTPKN
jgi:hypothetical protein